MIRITADLDNTPLSVARIRTYAIMEYMKNKDILLESPEIRLSSSGKGCHVILWSNEKLEKYTIFFIRMLLGDDFKRLSRDFKRRRAKQYLFKRKIRLNKAMLKV